MVRSQYDTLRNFLSTEMYMKRWTAIIFNTYKTKRTEINLYITTTTRNINFCIFTIVSSFKFCFKHILK